MGKSEMSEQKMGMCIIGSISGAKTCDATDRRALMHETMTWMARGVHLGRQG
jgi:hypothetical protein